MRRKSQKWPHFFCVSKIPLPLTRQNIVKSLFCYCVSVAASASCPYSISDTVPTPSLTLTLLRLVAPVRIFCFAAYVAICFAAYVVSALLHPPSFQRRSSYVAICELDSHIMVGRF
ncbi:hypothetical protein MtrunA17_Chr4g0049311 [Medicago truncatula]|uniref:Transmembrane protein, putative n=1 Tax=Medicago truncatula TaxID=3880 RepID=G7JTY8_MEDTR|nr:transmembrane protein, putative [Medicago truncatula]RHN62611.1 hypothetical protein MtrunA17_Chr4g0049311 [Medicago truncatula]